MKEVKYQTPPGLTITPDKDGTIRIRVRRTGSRGKFDRSIGTTLLFEKPEDQKKVYEAIDESIDLTRWKPYNVQDMENLFIALHQKVGKEMWRAKYEHIKPGELIDRCRQKTQPQPVQTNHDDPVLTELRLIRNYLEKLTLLQEASND